MTGGEAAEAMRKGIINGSQTTGPAILSRRYYEFARYINRWEIGPVLESLYVNKKILDALTSKTRNLVISTADEIEASMWKEAPRIREKELNILKDKGMSIISITKKELVRSAEITQEERNKWFDKAGALGQKVKEILDKAREK
jgi:TRAP-type C4-dicarboxylate transport system substrate-binding protein